jgi:ribosomal-protein-alanine N-acetyltransferase
MWSRGDLFADQPGEIWGFRLPACIRIDTFLIGQDDRLRVGQAADRKNVRIVGERLGQVTPCFGYGYLTIAGVMETVSLKPVQMADGAALIAGNLASRALHAPWVRPFTEQAGFETWFAGLQDGASLALLAREAGGGIAGVIAFSQIALGNFCSAYCGFYGMAGFGGRGLMTAALRLAVTHAFTALGLHRVEANIQPGNARSIELVRRVGFRREGFSPAYLRIDGVWRDHERWALLASDGDAA